MIRFVDPPPMGLDDLVVELESDSPCDVVVGGGSKEEALERFAEALRFPGWFGRNLDALYELLDEQASAATAGGGDWTLLWVPSARLVVDHPRDYARVVAVLGDVAAARSRAPRGRADAHGARHVVVLGPDPSDHPERRSPA